MTSSKSALIIFVRNPILGKVKTRIAKDLGDDVALDVYKKLLSHTHSITRGLNIDLYVFYADFINNDDLWNSPTYNKELQNGMDLGERMKNAFELLFTNGYSRVAVIGSDCFELTQTIIEQALQSLNDYDAVIGPSLDGGYYLLGMNKFIPQVFANKDWSTETVFRDTILDLDYLNHRCHLLQDLSDVDTAVDCKRYSSLLSLST